MDESAPQLAARAEGRRRGQEHYPVRQRRGDAFAGMASTGRLPGHVPFREPRAPGAAQPRPASAHPHVRGQSSQVREALGGSVDQPFVGSHFTIVNGNPLTRGSGGRKAAAELKAPHFRGAGVMLRTDASDSGLGFEKAYGAAHEGRDEASHFKPGGGMHLHTQALPRREGRAHGDKDHPCPAAQSHFKHSSVAPLLRTGAGASMEAGGKHHTRPAAQGHFKPGYGCMLKTEVSASQRPLPTAPAAAPAVGGRMPKEPSGCGQPTRGGSHFACGSMLLQPGAGAQQFLRVSRC